MSSAAAAASSSSAAAAAAISSAAPWGSWVADEGIDYGGGDDDDNDEYEDQGDPLDHTQGQQEEELADDEPPLKCRHPPTRSIVELENGRWRVSTVAETTTDLVKLLAMRLAKVKELGFKFVESHLPKDEVSRLWARLHTDWLAERDTEEKTKHIMERACVLAKEKYDAQWPIQKRTKTVQQLFHQVYHDTMRSRFQVSIGNKFGDTLWVTLLLRNGFINKDLVNCCNEVHLLKRKCFMEERKVENECW
jgi:hypothetical protein